MPRANRFSTNGVVLANLATMLFGAAGLFGNLALPATEIVLGRVVFAALAIWVVLRRKLLLVPRTLIPALCLNGLVLAIHWVTFFKAVQVSSVAVALVAFSTFPLFSILLEWRLSRTRLLATDIFAAGLALLGVCIVSGIGGQQNAKLVEGVAWGVCSGLTFAVLAVSNHRIVRRLSTWTVTFWQDLFAAAFLVPTLLLSAHMPSARDLGWLVLLGTVFTAVSHSRFIEALKHIRTQTASVIGSLEPVYGAIAAVIVLREVPSWRTVVGGVVLLAGALLVSLNERRASPTAIPGTLA